MHIFSRKRHRCKTVFFFIAENISPMSMRNFPPSFWNSQHPSDVYEYPTDPWHPHYPQYHHRSVLPIAVVLYFFHLFFSLSLSLSIYLSFLVLHKWYSFLFSPFLNRHSLQCCATEYRRHVPLILDRAYRVIACNSSVSSHCRDVKPGPHAGNFSRDRAIKRYIAR